jgi:hypothetical protein
MEFLLQIMLAASGFYAAFGFVLALAFVTVVMKSVDPAAKNGRWRFRLLILPGVAAFWPVLLYRWKGGGVPPILFVEQKEGPPLYLLLVGVDRRSINGEILDFAAKPIQITGEVEGQGQLLIFQADLL